MAYLKIHCGGCGRTWEIYHRDNWNDSHARQCPHCFKEIDRQTWQREVIPAFNAVYDANAELYKDHTGQRVPLFSFDVIADKQPENEPEDELSRLLWDFDRFLND